MDLRYNADLFDAVRMEEMLRQFFNLLRQIGTAPNRTIGSFSLLTEASRHVLPDPTVALSEPRFAPVTSEFLARVRQSPEQTAVTQTGPFVDVQRIGSQLRGNRSCPLGASSPARRGRGRDGATEFRIDRECGRGVHERRRLAHGGQEPARQTVSDSF